VDEHSGPPESWPGADVAIDFSVADAVPATVKALAARGTPIVIGTTGWQRDEARVRASAAGIGVVAAPNFAIGVNVFPRGRGAAGQLMAAQPAFGGWIHELHHAAKRTRRRGRRSRSSAACATKATRRPCRSRPRARARFPARTRSASTRRRRRSRCTHQARDRGAFARGALVAARWVIGRTGWFSMTDVCTRTARRTA
jgi:4-hydroxy-tetrahydrodipicolinate reductase